MGLKYGVQLSKDVTVLAAGIRLEYKTLTDYESLDLALKAEQNELFKRAFVILNDDSKPTALESIAISMGQRG